MSSLFGKSKKRKRTSKEYSLTPLLESSSGNRNVNIDPDEEIEKAGTKQDAPLVPLRGKSRQQRDIEASTSTSSLLTTFEELGLSPTLVATCRSLGFKRPTPVQRTLIPHLLKSTTTHVLALAATGSGKTASFVLPILQHLSLDPYGIYAIILTPTRELGKQIQEQILVLGSSLKTVRSTLVVGGMDEVRQVCELNNRQPHFVVATPGRLAELLRTGHAIRPAALANLRYVVLDEADRLLTARSGFERDVAEVLLHCTTTTTSTTAATNSGGTSTSDRIRKRQCQTLLFSATMTRSLKYVENMAGAGLGRLPLKKFVIQADDEKDGAGNNDKHSKDGKERQTEGGEDNYQSDERVPHSSSKGDETKMEDDNGSLEESDDNEDDDVKATTPRIPAGLRMEYLFMPSRVRDAYLVAVVRTLIKNGGRRSGVDDEENTSNKRRKGVSTRNGRKNANDYEDDNDDEDGEEGSKKARSAIIFVSTCERAGKVSALLTELGVPNVALHSLLSQNRRLASLAKFKSEQARILVATDVASRGLDVPTVDLVINSELPRRPVDYVHRVGRSARAGRRGRAVSLVCETDVALVHAAEELCGRKMDKCAQVTDEMAVRMLNPVTKASRLAKMKLMDIGFDELVKKMKERKARDRRERYRAERAAAKVAAKMAKKKSLEGSR